VGWEHCRGQANLTKSEMDQICAYPGPFGKFTVECNKHAISTNKEWLSEPGLALPDPVTMTIALDPEVCTKRSKHYVDVEINSDVTRGMTVVDQLGVRKKEANIEVCWEIDIQRWKNTLYKTLQ